MPILKQCNISPQYLLKLSKKNPTLAHMGGVVPFPPTEDTWWPYGGFTPIQTDFLLIF
jgi:hypothetical protein